MRQTGYWPRPPTST